MFINQKHLQKPRNHFKVVLANVYFTLAPFIKRALGAKLQKCKLFRCLFAVSQKFTWENFFNCQLAKVFLQFGLIPSVFIISTGLFFSCHAVNVGHSIGPLFVTL